jgi:DNA-binding NarL/FixJ family response regulator
MGARQRYERKALTEQMKQVLSCIESGKSYPKICEQLNIKKTTLESCFDRIKDYLLLDEYIMPEDLPKAVRDKGEVF